MDKITPSNTVVCTAFDVFSALLAPMSRAMTTPAPVENPWKKPTNKNVREETPLTAANACGPRSYQRSMSLQCYTFAGINFQ